MLRVSRDNVGGMELAAITRYEIDHAALNMDPAKILGKISGFYSHIASNKDLAYMMLEYQEYIWPIIDKHIHQAIELEKRIFRHTPEADASMLSAAINGLLAPRPLSIVQYLYNVSMDRDFCKYFSDNTYLMCILDIEDEMRYNSDSRDERKITLNFNQYTGMRVSAYIKAYRFDLPGTRQYIVSVRTSIRDSDYHEGAIIVVPESASMEEAIVQASLLTKLSSQLSPGYLDELADSLEQLGSQHLPETLRAASRLAATIAGLGARKRSPEEYNGDSMHIYSDSYGTILQASAVSCSRPVRAELYVRLNGVSTYYLEVV